MTKSVCQHGWGWAERWGGKRQQEEGEDNWGGEERGRDRQEKRGERQGGGREEKREKRKRTDQVRERKTHAHT